MGILDFRGLDSGLRRNDGLGGGMTVVGTEYDLGGLGILTSAYCATILAVP